MVGSGVLGSWLDRAKPEGFDGGNAARDDQYNVTIN